MPDPRQGSIASSAGGFWPLPGSTRAGGCCPTRWPLPLITAGLAAAALFAPAATTDRALGAALGWLGLRAIAWVYLRLRGRDGLGGGDAKLLAAVGAWVGAAALPDVILAAALLGLAVALCMRLAGMRLGAATALPFGPCLAL